MTRWAWAALLIAGPASAGVYDPTEAPPIRVGRDGRPIPLPPNVLRLELAERLRTASPPDGFGAPGRDADRKKAERRVAELRNLPRLGPLGRAELHALLLKLRNVDEVISEFPAGRASGFPAVNHAAMAYFLEPQLATRARGLQPMAVEAVPDADWGKHSAARMRWARRAEGFLLRLIRSRAGGGGSGEGVDPIFTGGDGAPVRFGGDGYRAGGIAKAEFEKLPEDALALTQQLVLWLPGDTRLYWQLGEVYNAFGDPEAAKAVFDDCVDSRRYSNDTLFEHRRVLAEGLQALAEQGQEATAAPGWLPETDKLILVGVVGGGLIALLGYFQWRELRKRRRPAQNP